MDGPLYIAKEKGFFQDEGVELQLIKLGDLEGEPLGVEALAADQVDAVMTTVDTALSTGVKSRASATCSLSMIPRAAMALSLTWRSRMSPG